jgi:hypothetical protein
MERIKEILNDPHLFRNFMRKNKKEIAIWVICYYKHLYAKGSLVVIAFLAYMYISSGDFSFLLTLSATIQMAGFLLIIVHVLKSKNSIGLSANTFSCYSISMFARFLSHIIFDGYLPSDKTGDHFLKLVEFISFLLSTSKRISFLLVLSCGSNNLCLI